MHPTVATSRRRGGTGGGAGVVVGGALLAVLFTLFTSSSLLLLVTTPPPVSCGVTYSFGFDNFTEDNILGQLNLVTNSQINPATASVSLTQAGPSRTQVGAAWYIANKVIVEGFTTTFTLTMGQPKNTSDPLGVRDGIAFVIQNVGRAEFVAGSGGLGYGSNDPQPVGIPNSLAIEFDTYRNIDLGDPVDAIDHISVHSKGKEPNSANETEAALVTPPVTAIPPLRGGAHSFKIVYANNFLAMFIDQNQGASFNFSYDLVEKLGLKDDDKNGTVWIGFSATCDEECTDQEINSWSFEYAGTDSAANSHANGQGLKDSIAGTEASFTIQAVDQFGYNMSKGGAEWNVTVTHTNNISALALAPVVPTVTDNDNGTYTVTFNATESGVYAISVSLSGTLISGAPWDLTVSAAGADAAQSTASGEGLAGPIEAGTQHTIQIQAKDRFGNIATQSVNDTFELHLVSGQDVHDIQAVSQGAGVYEVSYNLTIAKNYTVSITLGGVNIEGSPFNELQVIPSQPFAPNTTAKGDGIIGGDVMVNHHFNLTVVDRFGNIISEPLAANYTWKVTLERLQNGSHTGEITNGVVQPITVGANTIVYSVSYNATLAGDYQMNVTLNNVDIDGSPFNVHLVAGNQAWGPSSIVYGDGATAGIAGDSEQFVIQARDYFGNNLTIATNQTFAVTFGRKDGQDANVTHQIIETNVTGRYDVLYSTTTAYALYTVNITIDGMLIQNKTLTLGISPSAPYAPYSTAIGSGISKASEGKASNFTITTRDRYNNLVAVGGAKISVTIADKSEGKTITGSVVDNKNGKYSISYVLRDSGHYIMDVRLGDTRIADSPFFLEISDEPFDTKIFIWIGLGVGGALFIIVVLVAAVLYYRYRKRSQYTTFGL